METTNLGKLQFGAIFCEPKDNNDPWFLHNVQGMPMFVVCQATYGHYVTRRIGTLYKDGRVVLVIEPMPKLTEEHHFDDIVIPIELTVAPVTAEV